MQIPKKYYNAKYHEKWQALYVSKEDAYDLCTPAAYDGKGNWLALSSSIEVDHSISYRGDILICTESETYGLVELYEIVKGESHYVWRFRNPRRVVEFPVLMFRKNTDERKPFIYICPKGEITPYLRVVKLGEKGFKKILKK